MLHLRLFGGAVLESDRGRVTGRGAQRHQIALLALLATAPGHALSRDKLIGLLWPESDTKHARNLLNVAVYTVRRAVGDDALQSMGDGIQLAAARWGVDVIEFEAALGAREFERAVSLYAGAFLDGFFLASAPEFVRWQEGERDRLARRYAEALHLLAAAADAGGDPAKAAEWWRRLAAHDPYDSRTAMGFMRALARAGNPAAAAHHGQAHATLLRDELSVEPSPEVLAFAATLSRDQARAETAQQTQSAVLLPAQPAGPRVGWPLEARSPEADEDMSAPGTPGAGVPDRSGPSSGAPPPSSRTTRLRRAGARAVLIVLPLALAAYAGGWLGRAADTAGTEMPLPDGSQDTAAGAIASVAVLPFLNVGGDTANQYFADGMTDEVTTTLQRVPGLRVLSRRSAFAFKDSTGIDVRRIGQRLGVGAVVEGTVGRGGGRVRVTTQVTRVRDGAALWSETYEREMRDIFAVQDDIARAVARTLTGAFSESRPEPAPRARTHSVEAYNLYLKGRYFWNKRTKDGLQTALSHFREAMAIDPQFALAHAGLADAYALLGGRGHNYLAPREAYPRARQAARKAIALDSTLAEPHATLGLAAMEYDWDGRRAEQHFNRAIELNPSYATAHQWYAVYLMDVGRFEEAMRASERARELDPLSLICATLVAEVAYNARRYDRALDELRKARELDPNFPRVRLVAAMLLLQKGKSEEAIRELEGVTETFGGYTDGMRGYAYAMAGRSREATRIIEQLEERSRHELVPPFFVALIYVGLGDANRALEWLERSYRERLGPVRTLKALPLLDPLRSDPRFSELVRRMGLGP